MPAAKQKYKLPQCPLPTTGRNRLLSLIQDEDRANELDRRTAAECPGVSPVNPCQHPRHGIGLEVGTVVVMVLRRTAAVAAFLVVVIIGPAG